MEARYAMILKQAEMIAAQQRVIAERDAEIARLRERIAELEAAQRRVIKPYPSTKPYVITVNVQDFPIVRFAEVNHAIE